MSHACVDGSEWEMLSSTLVDPSASKTVHGADPSRRNYLRYFDYALIAELQSRCELNETRDQSTAQSYYYLDDTIYLSMKITVASLTREGRQSKSVTQMHSKFLYPLTTNQITEKSILHHVQKDSMFHETTNLVDNSAL